MHTMRVQSGHECVAETRGRYRNVLPRVQRVALKILDVPVEANNKGHRKRYSDDRINRDRKELGFFDLL